MSVDTRTPRTPTGGGSPGFDEPALSMARVPSDPAQVIVTHASFRVRLGAAAQRRALGLDDTAPIHVAGGQRKPAPVVWSGSAAPGDRLAGELQHAMRRANAGADLASATTQVLPRIDDTTVLPTPRAAEPVATGLLSGVRPARGAYDEPDEPVVGYVGGGAGGHGGHYDDGYGVAYAGEPAVRPRGRRGEPVKHAWYPGRRMNLGIVLLPLRVFLGFVCVYAGIGKLCDPVYFDGGRRGSMVKWLLSLHPWALAEPLRTAALDHPVGAGLSIAFLQIVVGALTVVGLWQRLAACFGAALSAALLVTVSWATVPVYDAPDFIYLAAWSPLVIAGAPVYSIDGHLAGDAWRRLGPRVSLWDLRRRVLRRGAVLATVIVGFTLLVGSVLGAAVRAGSTLPSRPGPTVVPTNDLPGEPLPEVPGAAGASPTPTGAGTSPRPVPRHTPTTPLTTGPGRGATTAPGTAAAVPATGGTSGGTGGGGGAGGAGPAAGTGSGPAKGSGSTAPAPPRPAPSAPPAPAPAPPPPSPRPTQGGAIGGLLGSRSPTGLLLGMPTSPPAGSPTTTA